MEHIEYIDSLYKVIVKTGRLLNLSDDYLKRRIKDEEVEEYKKWKIGEDLRFTSKNGFSLDDFEMILKVHMPLEANAWSATLVDNEPSDFQFYKLPLRMD